MLLRYVDFNTQNKLSFYEYFKNWTSCRYLRKKFCEYSGLFSILLYKNSYLDNLRWIIIHYMRWHVFQSNFRKSLQNHILDIIKSNSWKKAIFGIHDNSLIHRKNIIYMWINHCWILFMSWKISCLISVNSREWYHVSILVEYKIKFFKRKIIKNYSTWN